MAVNLRALIGKLNHTTRGAVESVDMKGLYEGSIVDNPAEYGLWYRLSPICFLGGSLFGPGALRDPMEAAALGSAILHGPEAGPYGAILGRLNAARAVRSITSAVGLGEALSEVLAPDRTARMAQAAWAVATDGAEVTMKTATLIRRLMDGEA